jgi:hypothetical protein
MRLYLHKFAHHIHLPSGDEPLQLIDDRSEERPQLILLLRIATSTSVRLPLRTHLIATSHLKMGIHDAQDLSRPNATESLEPVTNSTSPYLETVTRSKSLCLGTVLLQIPMLWDKCFYESCLNDFAHTMYSHRILELLTVSRARSVPRCWDWSQKRPTLKTITVFSLRVSFTCTHCTL